MCLLRALVPITIIIINILQYNIMHYVTKKYNNVIIVMYIDGVRIVITYKWYVCSMYLRCIL